MWKGKQASQAHLTILKSGEKSPHRDKPQVIILIQNRMHVYLFCHGWTKLHHDLFLPNQGFSLMPPQGSGVKLTPLTKVAIFRNRTQIQINFQDSNSSIATWSWPVHNLWINGQVSIIENSTENTNVTGLILDVPWQKIAHVAMEWVLLSAKVCVCVVDSVDQVMLCPTGMDVGWWLTVFKQM